MGPADLAAALGGLSRADAGLKHAIAAIDAPVIRRRPGGMEGLARIVMGQQVSVASAQAIIGRVRECVDLADPAAVLAKSDEALRAAGLSRPKVRYIKAIAAALQTGACDLTTLADLPDDEALARLVAITGIGPWSAAIYLLFCEGRLSVWPPRDVALLAAYAEATGTERMEMQSFDAHAAEQFKPLPGLAAHVLWTYYGVLKKRAPV